MTVEKPKPKQLLRPITKGADSATNLLKNWRESFKPITKRSNCNHAITFDSHLKTALLSTIRKRYIYSRSVDKWKGVN